MNLRNRDSVKNESTLCVSLQVSGQLHGEDGVEEGGDQRSIQAAHCPEHFEQQQAQRHTVLLYWYTTAK